MRTVVSDVDLYVSCTSGHAARLKAGEPREIRDDLAVIAFTEGAYAVRPTGETEKVKVPAEPAVLKEAVRKACEKALDEGTPEDFTASGRPKVRVIEVYVDGFEDSEITPAIIDEVWAEMTRPSPE
jgi:hypothetical protein